jgi:fatty-acyl-CoA synthase
MNESERPLIKNLADVEKMELQPWEGRLGHATVFDAIAAQASAEPDRMAIQFLPGGEIDDDVVSLTYAEFAARIRCSANMFRSIGVARGDAVAFLVPPLPQSHYGLWGASLAGIASPINFLLAAEAIAEIISGSGAKTLVAYDDADEGFGIWEKVEKIRALVPGIERIFRIGPPGSAETSAKDGAEEFDEAIGEFGDAALEIDRMPGRDDDAFYIHTGGTTGTPKLARITHGAILLKAWSTSVMQGLLNDEVLFGAAPLYHVGGIEPTSAVPFANGMTIVIPGTLGFRNRNLIANYWKYFSAFGITRLYGVPTSYTAIANVPIDGADISMVRGRVAVGSAPLSADLAKSIEKKTGIELANLYGLTEAAAAISIAPPDGKVRHGSCGIRYPYVQIKIVSLDADHKTYRECAANESGEIIIKGPNVSPGYLNEIHNANLFTDDGYMVTGDIGRADEDGYLWITGRAKDIIIRGGHNIDPQIVEESLYEHASVQIVGAVGRPDSYAGEMPVAYVQLKQNTGADAGDLKSFARQHVVERAAAPSEVYLLDSMPLTAIGKVNKRVLRVDAAKRHFTEVILKLGSDQGVELSVDVQERAATGITLVVEAAGVVDAGKIGTVRNELERLLEPYALSREINFPNRR